MGRPDGNRRGTCHDPHSVKAGKNDHVENGNLSQEERVARCQCKVDGQDAEEERRDPESNHAAQSNQDRDHCQAVRQREIAGREWPKPLVRVMAVGGQVKQVVEQITAGCTTSERYKGQDRLLQ